MVTRIFKLLGFTLLALLIIIIGLFAVTYDTYTVPQTVESDTALPQITIDGVTFHAETFGDPSNPAVVVVHGGPGGDYGYLLNLHELEDDYYVVFYDQQGAGLSPRVSAESLTLQSNIDDLHRIVTQYGQGEPVRIIGHSWGAMLAAAYVGQHPESVTQVVLAEPGALDNAGLARFNERQAASSRSLAYYRLLIPTIFESMHIEDADRHAQMDYVYGKMSAEFVNTAASGYRCADETIVPVEPTVPVPPSRFGTTAYQTLFGTSADLSPISTHAKNYTGDVLFLAGACSSFIGADFQSEHMGLFPQAELTVIPNAGHEMVGENPTATLAVVRGFFGR
jgi:proline iminopeptidase